MADSFVLGGHHVQNGARPFVIAEIAQGHDGSLGTAHAYVDAVARAGASAIKFQTHIAAAESTPGEPFRVKFSRQDATRWDYWKRMEFTAPQWAGLAAHAREVGLVFLSTPFSFEAFALLERLDLAAWKVGSGEITNLPMLEAMARTGRPVLLSSGLASWDDLDQATACVRAAGAPVGLFQCTTAYPCPPERLGLNVIAELGVRYGAPSGLSDHSGTTHAGIAATALGAAMLEVHVVFSRECFGPDVPASVTTSELRTLVDGISFVHAACSARIDKAALSDEMRELRRMFGKSVVAARDLESGHILGATDLALKKPATGLPPARLATVVGRRLARAVRADQPLHDEDFEP